MVHWPAVRAAATNHLPGEKDRLTCRVYMPFFIHAQQQPVCQSPVRVRICDVVFISPISFFCRWFWIEMIFFFFLFLWLDCRCCYVVHCTSRFKIDPRAMKSCWVMLASTIEISRIPASCTVASCIQSNRKRLSKKCLLCDLASPQKERKIVGIDLFVEITRRQIENCFTHFAAAVESFVCKSHMVNAIGSYAIAFFSLICARREMWNWIGHNVSQSRQQQWAD